MPFRTCGSLVRCLIEWPLCGSCCQVPYIQQHNLIHASCSPKKNGACLYLIYCFLLFLKFVETQEYSGLCSAGTDNKHGFCEDCSPLCGSHCQVLTSDDPFGFGMFTVQHRPRTIYIPLSHRCICGYDFYSYI